MIQDDEQLSHPFVGDTLIIIDIQPPANQQEILTCIRETFDYMPGWAFCGSVYASPTDARFFCFNLSLHTFEWWRKNETYSDTMDEDEVAIKDLADISRLLEFVYENSESLRLPKATIPLPPKKRKKDKEYDMEWMAKKLMEAAKNMPAPPMIKAADFPHVQPMQYPKGQVFYMDYVTQVTPVKAKPTKLKAKWAPDEEQKLESLMDDDMVSKLAEEIKSEIDADILAQMLKTVTPKEPETYMYKPFPPKENVPFKKFQAEYQMNPYWYEEHEPKMKSKMDYYYSKIKIPPSEIEKIEKEPTQKELEDSFNAFFAPKSATPVDL